MPGTYLAACVADYFLRDPSLFFDKIIDCVLEFCGFGLCGVECQLGLLLLGEFISARGDNVVVRAYRAKLPVEGHEFLLIRSADRIQVLDDLALRSVDKVAQRLQPARIVDERCFRQKAGKEVRLGFCLQKPA